MVDPGRCLLVLSFVLMNATLAIIPARLDLSGRFYEVAAQVIPVLLLAAAVEGRAFRIEGVKDRSARAVTGAALFMIFFGEGVALYVVASGCTSLLTEIQTIFALVSSAGLVFWAALFGPPRSP